MPPIKNASKQDLQCLPQPKSDLKTSLTAEQVRFNRLETVKLARRGWTEQMISEHLGVTPKEVRKYLDHSLRKAFQATRPDVDVLRARRLEELAEIKREAWLEWEKSKEVMVKHVEETVESSRGSTTRDTVTTEGRLGDPRYLNVIKDCVSEECAIEGTYASKKVEVSGTLVNWDVIAGRLPDSGRVSDEVEDAIRMALEESARMQEALPAPDDSEVIYVDPE